MIMKSTSNPMVRNMARRYSRGSAISLQEPKFKSQERDSSQKEFMSRRKGKPPLSKHILTTN